MYGDLARGHYLFKSENTLSEWDGISQISNGCGFDEKINFTPMEKMISRSDY